MCDMCHGGILIAEKRPAVAAAAGAPSNHPASRNSGAGRHGEKKAIREAPSGIKTLGEICTLRCAKSLMLFLFSGCKVNYVRLGSERNGSEAITAHLRAGCPFTRCSSPPNAPFSLVAGLCKRNTATAVWLCEVTFCV